MARLPRFVIPNQPQHVILRGNDRKEVFCADEDYRFFLEKLELACKQFGCLVHAYVLMTNHVHLLITPTTEQALSKTMQSLGRHYVRHFNDTYRHSGTLWEGRYKATLIDSEAYLLTCMRYIELNPVRARMVNMPEGYPWSSFCFNALGVENPLLSAHLEYVRLGADAMTRQTNYLALFNKDISERSLDEIREATNKAWVLGDDGFKARIESQLNRRATPLGRGGDRKSELYRKINGV